MIYVQLILILLAGILVCKWLHIRNRTIYFHLYSVASHGSKPATIHMRFKNCPVGKDAVFEIYEELQSTLIELQKKGYDRVKFVSHLFRKGGTYELLNFLNSHGMVCEQKAFRPTPWTHALSNKVLMRYHKKRGIKVSSKSLDITIRLHSDSSTSTCC